MPVLLVYFQHNAVYSVQWVSYASMIVAHIAYDLYGGGDLPLMCKRN